MIRSLENMCVQVVLNNEQEKYNSNEWNQLKAMNYEQKVEFFETNLYHPIAVLLAETLTINNISNITAYGITPLEDYSSALISPFEEIKICVYKGDFDKIQLLLLFSNFFKDLSYYNRVAYVGIIVGLMYPFLPLNYTVRYTNKITSC